MIFFLVLCLRVIPSLMFPPGPTTLPTTPSKALLTQPNVAAPAHTMGTAFTVATSPPEKQSTMAPGALATEAATGAQPPSQTDGAQATVDKGTVAETTVADALVTVSTVPVVSTVAATAHLVPDQPVVKTAAPATAAGDVEPAQTAAAEAQPNGAVVIEEGADEVNGKKCVGQAGN